MDSLFDRGKVSKIRDFYTVPMSVDTFKTLGPYNWTPFVGAPFLVDTLSLCVS